MGIHTIRRPGAFVGLVILVICLGLACDRDTQQGDLDDREPPPEASDEGAPAFGGDVDCPGFSADDPSADRARLVYGQLLAPDGRLADASPRWWVPTFATAHADQADQIDGESPVAQRRVWLTRADERAEPIGDVLAQTTTDDQGRWCFQVPEDTRFGPTLLVIAEGDEERLRRPVLQSGLLDLDARAEALVRLLVEEGHQFTKLDTDTYNQLDAMARALLDRSPDLKARADAGLASFIDRLNETMEIDRPLMEAIDEAHIASGDHE